MARFKRLADSINYSRPVIAMTDNIKLYPCLGYSANLGYIIGSTLPLEQTYVEDYNEVKLIIQNIISNNAVAKQVHLYLLQVSSLRLTFDQILNFKIPLPKFPPVVVRLILNNGNETSVQILQMHKQVLEIAEQIFIYIVFVGADGAISEFNVQKYLMAKDTEQTISFIGPVIQVSDSLYTQKSARNALFSKVRLLTLGHYIAMYNQILDLCKQPDSVLYKKNVINCDHQNDGASYRLFCFSFLNQVLDSNISENNRYGLFIYLFVIGELIDAYQNRTISHLKRARMLRKEFSATQTLNILISLAESLILLIISYRNFYPSYLLLPWLHGSEGYEHFFRLYRQINNDFSFFDLLYLVPKVLYVYKTYMTGTLNEVIKDRHLVL
ncbi:29126_t:CDS:2, partial [Racocetra persica]